MNRINSFLLNYRDGSLLLCLLIFSRPVPHWPNVTALGALVVLAPLWSVRQSVSQTGRLTAKLGAKNHGVWVLPLIGMLVSDGILGFHRSMIFTYSAVFLFALWGLFAPSTEKIISDLSKKTKMSAFFEKSLWGRGLVWSLFFFMVSNFGAWMVSEASYERSPLGLLHSYINGLPFLGYEALGTLTYLFVVLALQTLMEWVLAIDKSSLSART